MLGGAFSPALPVEEKPVELTLVDLPPAPLVPKNSAFMETDESKQSAEPPKEKTFESNANSIAASELPATGEAPLPSQQGKDRPSVDLETHAYAPEIEGRIPQPSAAPQEKAKAFGNATADTAASSGDRSGAICDVNRTTHPGGSALRYACTGAGAIRVSSVKGSNAHLRERSQIEGSLRLMRWALRSGATRKY